MTAPQRGNVDGYRAGEGEGGLSALTWAQCVTAHGEYLSSSDPVIRHHPCGMQALGTMPPVVWFMALKRRELKWFAQSHSAMTDG